MRWHGLLILLAGACSESGAHFTLSAPQGPESASSFRVILATPEQIPSIANQRVGPNSNQTQTVPYFLQRTVAGVSEGSIEHVDGLRIKLEADFAAMPETTFIPFVLLYDAHGSVIGVGTYHAAGQTMPSPVLVMPDEIDKYVLDGIREPAQEWLASPTSTASCTPTYQLYDQALVPEARPGKTADQAKVTIDVLGVVDLDGDGRKELVLAMRFPTVRTIVVYTATESSQRLELAGEATSFAK